MLHSWSISARRFTFFLSLLAAIAVFAGPRQALAQWVEVQFFTGNVTAIYFHTAIGLDQNGVVGLDNGQIWLTNTEGAGWSKAVITPALTTTSRITRFTWKDGNIGWASWSDAGKGGGVLQTTDGGATWAPQFTTLEATAVYYHAPTSRLFLSLTGGPAKVSIDDGANYTDIPGSNDWLGYSFWDANVGIVSTVADGVYRTTNGGATWSLANFGGTSEPTWTPLAVKGTTLGFIAGTDVDSIYRSYDKGATWKVVGTLGQDRYLTGHMENTCGLIWTQLEDQNPPGIFYSINQGDTWIPFGDGPPGSLNVEFELSKSFIFAAQGPSLYRVSQPPTAPETRIRFERRDLRVFSNGCAGVDSSMRFYLINFCDPYTITNLTLSGSPDFSIKNSTLPYTLGGKDSIVFVYSSQNFGRDSAYVKIEYTVNGVPKDTTILLIGERLGTQRAQLSYNALKTEIAQPCVALDTTFSIFNTPCDVMRLLSVRLSDSSMFRIQYPLLPNDVPVNSSADVRITAAASVQGTYTAKLYVRYEMAGRQFDTIISLEYKVRTGPLAPVIPPMNFVLDNPCTKLDTVVRWLNRLCVDLRLDSIMVEPNKGVTLGSPAPLPALPTEIIRYPIRIQGAAKGKYTAKVKLSFTDQQGVSFDTTITINYEVKNGLPTKINAPASFVFRATSICAPRQQTLYIENTLCDPITLTGQTWISSNPTITIISQPAANVVLAPGQKDSVVLQFAPTASGNQAATLRVDYRVQSTMQFAQISVSGVGTTQANAALSDELLVFDSVYSCEAVPERFTHLTNEGCDSIVITSLSQLAGNDFIVVEPTLPVKIAPGDSVKIVLRPKGRQGAIGDSIDLVYRSLSGGADQAARLRLEGYTRPPVRLVEMTTSFTFENIPPCNTKDTTIRIYNRGICDTLVINSVNVAGLGGVTVNAATPLRIAPDEFLDIQITMNTGTGGINGTATVTVSGNIDTTFTVNVTTSTGGGGESTLSVNAPETTYTVPPCGTQTNTFTFTAQGCGDFTLARVALESTFPGQTQFTLNGPAPGVIQTGTTVTYTVTFDASGNGNNAVDLVLESADGKFVRRIPLTATVSGSTGVFSLRLAGEGGATSFTRAPGEKLNVEFYSDQNVDAGLNLSEVTFDLAYDIDVMSSTSSAGANGWSVTAQPTATGTHLVFTKAATTSHNSAQPLGSLEYTVRLAEQKATQLTIGDPTLNGGDADYIRCILRPQASSGSVNITVQTDLCDDDMIRDAMAGRPFLKIIALKPSSVLKASALANVSLEYDLAAESQVMLSVQDQLGRVVAQQNVHRSAGMHSESLRLPSVEGIYFVTIQTPHGGTETRKLVIE